MGEDDDNDLVREFEIATTNNKYHLRGHNEKYKSLKDLLNHYKTAPLHPSISNIGERCLSPRSNYRLKRRESKKAQAEVKRAFQEQREEDQRKMKEMDAKIRELESRWRCVVQ